METAGRQLKAEVQKEQRTVMNFAASRNPFEEGSPFPGKKAFPKSNG